MGHCSQDLHLCWTTRLLGIINLLCACSTLARSSGAHGSGIRTHTYLKAIRGGSVLLRVIQEPGEDPKVVETSWGFVAESESTYMLRIQNGKEDPEWFSLQDKYKQRVQVPNLTSLRIHNLTSQDSGQYWAQLRFHTGREIKQFFHLEVHDPVPPAEIQTTSASITPSWCNATLECGSIGALEALNVTWVSKGLPRELEQRGSLGFPNPSTLAVNLPLSQSNVSLTCVLSNQVDQKNATLDLVHICSQDGELAASRMRGIVGAVVAVCFILGVGGFLWNICEKKKKKKMEMERGLPEDPRVRDDGIYYAQLMEQESQKDKQKDTGEKHLEGKEPCSSIYSEAQRPDQAMKITYLEEGGESSASETPVL